MDEGYKRFTVWEREATEDGGMRFALIGDNFETPEEAREWMTHFHCKENCEYTLSEMTSYSLT